MKQNIFLDMGLILLLAAGPGPLAAQDAAEAPFDLKAFPRNSKKPKAIKQDAPVYPYEMSRAGLVGSVEMSFVINTRGDVVNPYVLKSNNPWFERPAIDAMLKWKFTPGEMNGRPVNVRAVQRIDFRVDYVAAQEGMPHVYAAPREGLWHVTKGKNHEELPLEVQWDTPPIPTNTRFPVYPLEQLKAGTGGKAAVSYIVGPDGRVQQAKVRSATVPEFGEAVLAMIDAWQFTPPRRKDGTPCGAILGSEYEFKPGGRADVPVSEGAKDLLRALQKKPGTILSPDELDQPLKPLSRRPPVYPSGLQQTGQDGTAMIEFFIDKNGDAQLPWIVSSTAKEFGYAAVQAVATWRFDVPNKGGKPVFVRVRIPIEFSQRETKPAPKG